MLFMWTLPLFVVWRWCVSKSAKDIDLHWGQAFTAHSNLSGELWNASVPEKVGDIIIQLFLRILFKWVGVETTQIEIIHEYELSLKKIATQCPPSNVASEIFCSEKSKVEKWNGPFGNDLFWGAMLVSGRVNLLGSTVWFPPPNRRQRHLPVSASLVYSSLARERRMVVFPPGWFGWRKAFPYVRLIPCHPQKFFETDSSASVGRPISARIWRQRCFRWRLRRPCKMTSVLVMVLQRTNMPATGNWRRSLDRLLEQS